jgi:hypothetical protein
MININKHSLSAIFLAFILFTYNINNVVIVIDFLINQDEIAKTLCVQKEDQKGCNGKCQLVKELKLNTTDSKAPQQSSKITIIDCSYLQPTNNFYCSEHDLVFAEKMSDKKSYKTIVKYYDVDNPPPLIS